MKNNCVCRQQRKGTDVMPVGWRKNEMKYAQII
jgi:hypothetical protein